MTRCTCCDLPIESCGTAIELRRREEARVELARVLSMPGVFTSQYPGACSSCSTWYERNSPIRRVPGTALYVGPCCLEENRANAR